MLKFVIQTAILCGLLCSTTAHAITWDFNEEGNAQGWYARESHSSLGLDLQPLKIQVADGIMRVSILPSEEGKQPTALLVSPFIEHDSGMFDRVEARVRLVAQTPVVGRVVLLWTNPRNRGWPGNEPRPYTGTGRFVFVPSPSSVTFTTRWQTLSLQGFTEATELVWADTLIDIRLQFELGQGDLVVPEALEIDWIHLTGVDEQMQGELPPPPALSTPVPGALYAPAEFQSLSLPGLVRPLLGHLNGDDFRDLVISSDHYPASGTYAQFFAAAYNDGRGRFSRGGWVASGQELASRVNAGINDYEGGDLNGDGYMDLVMRSVSTIVLLINDRQGGFDQHNLTGGNLLGLADMDRDGDIDIVLGLGELSVLLNDGRGQYDQREVLALEEPIPAGTEWLTDNIGRLTSIGPSLVLWWQVVPLPFQDVSAYMVTSIGVPMGIADRQHLDASFTNPSLVCVGDLNNDGQVDLGITRTLQDEGLGFRASGMVALLNQGDGHFTEQEWLPRILLYPAFSRLPNLQTTTAWLRLWDLNGDSIPDQVYVDLNPRTGQNATVLLGRRGAMPVLEGQYALPGGILGGADAGDIDGDGDLDLVVATSYAGGGVWVLRNLSADQGTAVTGNLGTPRPAAFILGANYPNPFNPGTVIPLSLPTGGVVRVEILNLVGQQVCELQSGFLAAGDHRLTWDGRDAAGRPVAAGVYLCRTALASQVMVRKLVKLE